MGDHERGDRFNWSSIKKLGISTDWLTFRDYYFGFLFYKYISQVVEEGVHKARGDWKYSEKKDNNQWVKAWEPNAKESKGYFILPSYLFSNMLKKDDEDLSKHLTKAFKKIIASATDTSLKDKFSDLFDFHLHTRNRKNLGKSLLDINRKISEILKEVGNLRLKTEEFGDVFEDLIRSFASKEANNRPAPPEISKLLALLISKKSSEIKTIYDPACGFGFLLLGFLKQFSENRDLKFYGQENDSTRCKICNMNMFLHNLEHKSFDIKCADISKADAFENEKFDAIVCNCPTSFNWEAEDDRKFKGPDWHFVRHSFDHLKKGGVAAIACSKLGLLFRIQEKSIRQKFVNQNRIDAIIQLPKSLENMCILVLKESKQESGILFINAENCYKNKNQLLTQEIVNHYVDRQEKENISRVATMQEIIDEDYDLSIHKYIKKKKEKEKIDINELNKSIKESWEKVNSMMLKI